MANSAWPHIPASNYARLKLFGGPFAGEEAAFLPSDLPAPVQIVWSGWTREGGFNAWVYEWHGTVTMDQGRTDALVYLFTGRRLSPEVIPPIMAEDAEVWADGADLLMQLLTPIKGGMKWGNSW